MPALELNHVSVAAHDLQESKQFYEDVFAMEPVPTPNFEVPVQWLRCEDQQLHLFERDVAAPTYHHLGLTVDDFESVYATAAERDLFGNWGDSADDSLYLLPDGAVQMYLEDPAGNLIEVDHPDVETLSEAVRANIVNRAEIEDQTGEAARGTLDL